MNESVNSQKFSLQSKPIFEISSVMSSNDNNLFLYFVFVTTKLKHNFSYRYENGQEIITLYLSVIKFSYSLLRARQKSYQIFRRKLPVHREHQQETILPQSHFLRRGSNLASINFLEESD